MAPLASLTLETIELLVEYADRASRQECNDFFWTCAHSVEAGFAPRDEDACYFGDEVSVQSLQIGLPAAAPGLARCRACRVA